MDSPAATSSPGSTADSTGVRFGAWAMLGEPRTASWLARNADWVCLDAQHGAHDDRAVRETLELRREGDAPVLVRVLANTPAHIGRALDAGATGVIVPLVQNAVEAAAAVAATHHPPHGTRSWGPSPGIDYPDRPMCAVMIETCSSLGEAEEIARTPGLDMVFVGPFDLSLAIGADVDDVMGDHAPDAPLPRIVQACRAAGILCGAYAGTPERAQVLAGHGFGWIAVTSDVGLLALGADAARRTLSGAAG